jgi:hypothetical protein
MKRLGLLILAHFLLLAAPCFAQETNTSHEFDASLDIYTQHLWRGFSNGTSVSLQPAAECKFNGFTAGAWGAWCIDGSYTELDLFVAYKKGAFSATLYDYFCPVNPVEKFEFFEITQGQTKHTFDLNHRQNRFQGFCRIYPGQKLLCRKSSLYKHRDFSFPYG